MTPHPVKFSLAACLALLSACTETGPSGATPDSVQTVGTISGQTLYMYRDPLTFAAGQPSRPEILWQVCPAGFVEQRSDYVPLSDDGQVPPHINYSFTCIPPLELQSADGIIRTETRGGQVTHTAVCTTSAAACVRIQADTCPGARIVDYGWPAIAENPFPGKPSYPKPSPGARLNGRMVETKSVVRFSCPA